MTGLYSCMGEARPGWLAAELDVWDTKTNWCLDSVSGFSSRYFFLSNVGEAFRLSSV